MRRSLNVIRTTIAGGVLFLAPFAVVLFVLGKVFALAVKVVMPLAEALPFHSLIGLQTPWIMATLLLLLVCFAAGLLARTAAARRTVNWLEAAVLSNLPGYSFMKGVGEEFAGNEPTDHHESVLVRLDDGYLLGFLVERLESDELDLEASLTAFEQGMVLSRRGQQILDTAEERVEILLRDGRTEPMKTE